MKIIAVIPARYASTRFPAKPLADIHGKPMIWWVYNQVKKVAALYDVVVALDNEQIRNVCDQWGINYINTSPAHNTSTERLNEVAGIIDADFYICINGDEPLIDPAVIEKIIPAAPVDENDTFVSNLMAEIKNPVEVIDNTNIKVVVNSNNEAVFMSRSPIPHPKASLDFKYFKHVGVLCYNKKGLRFFSETAKGPIEKIEDINELRFIENNIRLKMVDVETRTLSVDTYKDLEYVRKYISDNNLI